MSNRLSHKIILEIRESHPCSRYRDSFLQQRLCLSRQPFCFFQGDSWIELTSSSSEDLYQTLPISAGAFWKTRRTRKWREASKTWVKSTLLVAGTFPHPESTPYICKNGDVLKNIELRGVRCFQKRKVQQTGILYAAGSEHDFASEHLSRSLPVT